MTKILLIEDDEFIANIICFHLQKEEKYTVDWVQTGGDGYSQIQKGYDIVLLDIMLPDVNGVELCKHIRSWYSMPIIYISCLDDADTIVNALAAGGDDFMVKPFDNKILLAKIEANLRRVQMMNINNEKGAGVIEIGDVTLDAVNNELRVAGELIHLPGMEYKILHCLMQQPGHFFTAKELYEIIWGGEYMGDPRTVQVHIHNLRKKLEKDSANPMYILNEWGKGYCFSDNKDK